MPSGRFSPFAWGVFLYTLAVIMWGYFLRISESGDGCGTDWPLCHGAVVPEAPPFATFVEFTHRLSSGVVLLLVLGLVVWAFRAFPRGSAVRKGAAASLLFTVTESLVGAGLVVLGWVAGDVSLGRILIRPFHVTNTFLLMAALALTAWWAWRGIERVPRLRGPILRLMALPLVGILALAWTGSWTGLATTAFPAAGLREGLGQYLDPEHLLIYLRVTHPLIAILVVALVLRMAMRVRGELRAHTPADSVDSVDSAPSGWRAIRGPAASRLALAAGGLAAVQLVAGPAVIALGSPPTARLLHLFLADLLWVAVVLLASTLAERAQAGAGRDAAAGSLAEPAASELSRGPLHPQS